MITLGELTMTTKPIRDVFKRNRKEQLSTLEMWQQQLQALKRASQGNANQNLSHDAIDASEASNKETTKQHNA